MTGFIQVLRTEQFTRWLDRLRDLRAKTRIELRLDRLAAGLPGDVKSVGHGVGELRIDYGPGYRVYFLRRDAKLVVLLCGGDKATQDRDIVRAKSIAATLGENL